MSFVSQAVALAVLINTRNEAALRDLSGSYALPFCGCMALEIAAAVLIMERGRTMRTT